MRRQPCTLPIGVGEEGARRGHASRRTSPQRRGFIPAMATGYASCYARSTADIEGIVRLRTAASLPFVAGRRYAIFRLLVHTLKIRARSTSGPRLKILDRQQRRHLFRQRSRDQLIARDTFPLLARACACKDSESRRLIVLMNPPAEVSRMRQGSGCAGQTARRSDFTHRRLASDRSYHCSTGVTVMP